MEKYITIQEKQIYTRFSDEILVNPQSPVIVFLHEGLGCSEQWKDFPTDISAQLQCPILMYDRYGYGKSEEIREHRPVDYMEIEASFFLPEVLKELGLQHRKIILFGHSDGGSIAAFYAAMFPEHVLAAIIEAPHFFIEEISVDGISAALRAYKNGNLREKLKRYHGDKTDAMIQTWTGVLLSDNMRTWNTEELLLGIRCPVLAIQGTEDDFGTIRQIETIRDHSSGTTELFVIEGCGHIPHHQERGMVFDRVLSFLKSLSI